MNKPIIEINHLSKKYQIGETQSYYALRDTLADLMKNPFKKKSSEIKKDEFWALKDINFTVNQGEVVGIIGRNGAGKSTLLKILSQITPPTEGEVILRGRVGSLLEVGTGFHPELTGKENIYLNGAILGMKRAEVKKKFDEIVDFAGVEKFLDMPMKRYSSGMYMRLAFAVAAHLETEILIVDEVLAVGDAEFQKKCLGKMGDVAKEGRTVLFVSHNMGSVRNLCRTTILLESGTVSMFSKTESVVERYTKSIKDLSSSYILKDKQFDVNKEFVIKKIAVENTLEKSDSYISTNSNFNIMITYKVFKPETTVGFTILLYSEDGQLLFSSLSNQEKKWLDKNHEPGTYTATCSIPANLLNNGRYIISVISFEKNYSNISELQHALTFEVLEGGNLRGDFTGIFGGYFRPYLNWEFKKND